MPSRSRFLDGSSRNGVVIVYGCEHAVTAGYGVRRVMVWIDCSAFSAPRGDRRPAPTPARLRWGREVPHLSPPPLGAGEPSPPTRPRSRADRTHERQEALRHWDALVGPHPLPLSRVAGEGRPEPRASAFQCSRSCVSSYFLSAPKPAPAGGGSRLVGVVWQCVRFHGVVESEARAPRGHTSSCAQQCVVRMRRQGDDEGACLGFYDARLDIRCSVSRRRIFPGTRLEQRCRM